MIIIMIVDVFLVLLKSSSLNLKYCHLTIKENGVTAVLTVESSILNFLMLIVLGGVVLILDTQIVLIAFTEVRLFYTDYLFCSILTTTEQNLLLRVGLTLKTLTILEHLEVHTKVFYLSSYFLKAFKLQIHFYLIQDLKISLETK